MVRTGMLNFKPETVEGAGLRLQRLQRHEGFAALPQLLLPTLNKPPPLRLLTQSRVIVAQELLQHSDDLSSRDGSTCSTCSTRATSSDSLGRSTGTGR